MSITCAEVVPSTSAEKDSTLSRSPLTMAARCRATPIPARYLLSASASAACTSQEV